MRQAPVKKCGNASYANCPERTGDRTMPVKFYPIAKSLFEKKRSRKYYDEDDLISLDESESDGIL